VNTFLPLAPIYYKKSAGVGQIRDLALTIMRSIVWQREVDTITTAYIKGEVCNATTVWLIADTCKKLEPHK